MSQTFSERFGYGSAEPEITVREDAPEDLRFAVAQLARDAGMRPSTIRDVICGVLYVPPDRGNWSEYPNIWDEVQGLLERCDWFKVYDIAEALHRRLDRYGPEAQEYRAGLNRLFRERGYGWEFSDDGNITYRGSGSFNMALHHASDTLAASGHANAAAEINEAVKDISRRPQADITGAIQHCIAALECTSREVTGEPNATLGKLIPKLNLPKPLDTAVEKLWGFASDRARHIREGAQVDLAEAELLVSVACAVCSFLASRRSPGSSSEFSS